MSLKIVLPRLSSIHGAATLRPEHIPEGHVQQLVGTMRDTGERVRWIDSKKSWVSDSGEPVEPSQIDIVRSIWVPPKQTAGPTMVAGRTPVVSFDLKEARREIKTLREQNALLLAKLQEQWRENAKLLARHGGDVDVEQINKLGAELVRLQDEVSTLTDALDDYRGRDMLQQLYQQRERLRAEPTSAVSSSIEKRTEEESLRPVDIESDVEGELVEVPTTSDDDESDEDYYVVSSEDEWPAAEEPTKRGRPPGPSLGSSRRRDVPTKLPAAPKRGRSTAFSLGPPRSRSTKKPSRKRLR